MKQKRMPQRHLILIVSGQVVAREAGTPGLVELKYCLGQPRLNPVRLKLGQIEQPDKTETAWFHGLD